MEEEAAPEESALLEEPTLQEEPTVESTNITAEAIWTAPVEATAGVPVTLDGTASAGNAPLACTWSFESEDGSTVWTTREGCEIEFTFEQAGTKYVKLTVRDVDGEAAANKQSFDVSSVSEPEPEPEPEPESQPEPEPEPQPEPQPEPEPEPEAEPTQQSSCFSKPSACGYPDPTNTGVPAGTVLTASGSITASTAGQTISGNDVTGSINITANNVTVKDTRITLDGSGCGSTNTCGNYDIRVNEGVTGTVIEHVETRAASGTTCEHDIRNTSSAEIRIVGGYLHACDSNLYTVGPATMTDTYGIAKIDISTDHVENIYFDDTTFTAKHDTLLNPVGQTAVVFGNVNGGSGGTCSNHLTIEESLLAGGGYTLYPCGNGTSAGSSSATIRDNHFARCTSQEVEGGWGTWVCSGGADSNGYYPNSGDYGVASYYFGGTWSGNVWDDDLATVSAP